jgi:predicted DNA-binding transcriptional regulator AlpA
MHNDRLPWSATMKLLTRAGLAERGITYSPSQLNRKMNNGTFPQAVKGTSKENCWVEEEINDYLKAQIAARPRRKLIPAAGTGRAA